MKKNKEDNSFSVVSLTFAYHNYNTNSSLNRTMIRILYFKLAGEGKNRISGSFSQIGGANISPR